MSKIELCDGCARKTCLRGQEKPVVCMSEGGLAPCGVRGSVGDFTEGDAGEDMIVWLQVGHKNVPAVIDTAAYSLWADAEWFRQAGGTVKPDSSAAQAVNGRPLEVAGRGRLTFGLWGCLFESYPVRLMRPLPSKVLIGRRFWIQSKLFLDLGSLRGEIMVNGRRYGGSIGAPEVPPSTEHIRRIAEDEDVEDAIHELDLRDFHPSPVMQKRLRKILLRRQNLFKGLGCLKGVEHRIALVEGAEPVCLPIRRRSPAEERVEREEVAKYVKMGVLEPAISPWAAANVFVPKKDGSKRITTDFRRLNSLTVADTYPMENVRETLDWLSSKRVFSTFDLKDGFFQIPLARESRPLTAVRTVLGLFQYTRLPQGLKNSPPTFQRAVNETLGDLKGQSVWSFFDDASVGSEDEESHLRELDEVLGRLEVSGMKLKLRKCRFGTHRAEVLGYVVDRDGIRPSSAHIAAIKDLKEPQNGAELLRFLGLMNYFGDFIEDFAGRARCLYQVLEGSGFNRKKRRAQSVAIKEWGRKWGEEQRNAWMGLKEDLSSPTVLASPRRDAVKKLMTDASNYGVGGVLLQQEETGAWRPVAFTSRKLKGAETRYTTTEKECLAVVHSLKKWRHYLQGSPAFEVVTDHMALRWLMSVREPRGRLARWMMEIQDFSFQVKYSPGRTLVVPDALSRDAVQKPLCDNCKRELVAEIREPSGVPDKDEIKDEQAAEYGNISEFVLKEDGFILDEDGLLCKQFGEKVCVVVPAALRGPVLAYFHGSKACGHYGIGRTSCRIHQRFWWPGWRADVADYIRRCVFCAAAKIGKPGRQGRMKVYHPMRRWQIVAVDVLEISPPSDRGNTKVLVVGDTFTRYVWACPMKDERADTVAQLLLDEWILRFGPPERLLSDQGKPFVSRVLRHLCEKVGTRKIFTSPYHPQTDGFVERFNRTICRDLSAYVAFHERDWDEHLPMACFRYNTSVHDSTGLTPFKAVFGVEAFDFDNEVGVRMRQDDRTEAGGRLDERLAELHRSLLSAGFAARRRAEKQYNKLVAECQYEVGDRVLVYDPPAAVERGRKLRTPWLGPYRVTEKLSPISYVLTSEIESRVARAHVNRLRKLDPEVSETGDPRDGVFPDSRRLIRMISDDRVLHGRRQLKVRSRGRRGFVWKDENELPELVVKAYFMQKKDEGSASE